MRVPAQRFDLGSIGATAGLHCHEGSAHGVDSAADKTAAGVERIGPYNFGFGSDVLNTALPLTRCSFCTWKAGTRHRNVSP